MTPAIFFHPDGYFTGGKEVVGRQAAGESFLRGILSYSTASEICIQVPKARQAEQFKELMTGLGLDRPVQFVDRENLGQLATVGGCYHPGPDLALLSRERCGFGDAAWSITGVTHTTATLRVMDELTQIITAPVQPWDALICTSTAVKANVERVMQGEVDRLKDRLGIQKLVLPRLPVIPLGIHPDDFVFSGDDRVAARQAVGASNKTHVVLYLGRLSFHAKANPFAMYRAFELAAQDLPAGEEILLIECGWHANDGQKDAFDKAAKLAAPSIRTLTLDGRDAKIRRKAWAAADVFCSLSDNIQETFGITPIEAMVAGLPVVVSDWDGYKETVRDGIDGFRVPTMMPAAGLGADLALRHGLELDTYDMYCGQVSSLIAVDIERTAAAFSKLFSSEELRRQMGAAGRERAREVYDWKHIIPQYEALWAELDAVRKADGPKLAPAAVPWPARPDPFLAFAAYPSGLLGDETVLELVPPSAGAAMDQVRSYLTLFLVNYTPRVIPAESEIRHILAIAEAGPSPALALVYGLSEDRRAFAFRGLAWLVKIGVLRVRAFHARNE
ncbi:MAG: glycosyltransferase family 4 protein [Roseibium sp.]|nr:glycosyltransferase family 4 protein [Roseibium sp.]